MNKSSAIKSISKYRFFILGLAAALVAVLLLTQRTTQPVSAHPRGSDFRSKAVHRAKKRDRNPVTNTTTDKVQTTIDEWAEEVPASTSVIISDLSSDQSAAVNPDEIHISASIYKLFVAYELFLNTENLDVELSNGYTAHECVEPMIIYSDNTCGYLLGDLVGWQNVNKTLEEIGLKSTDIDNYFADGNLDGGKTTSASDVSIFLDELLTGGSLDDEYTDEMLHYMLDQQINDRVPADLPEGYEIAHKTGNLDGAVHDVGYIISEDTTYSFVILTSGWSDEAAAAESINQLLTEILANLSS